MERSISTSPPVAVTKLTTTPARDWLEAIAGATLTGRYVSSAASPQTYASYRCAYSSTAFGKSEHANWIGIIGTRATFECELTIVDDERDVGNLRIFNLNVVHHENLRRQLPHQSSRWASKPVKGGKLCRGIHVTMLQTCQIQRYRGKP